MNINERSPNTTELEKESSGIILKNRKKKKNLRTKLVYYLGFRNCTHTMHVQLTETVNGDDYMQGLLHIQSFACTYDQKTLILVTSINLLLDS